MQIDASLAMQAKSLDAARRSMQDAQVKAASAPPSPATTSAVVLNLSAAAQQLLVKP
ncbi:MAG: hypothetical protein M3P39_10065 [Actinomycetota bacterium]|nr:hypothetical protein [Actinomycetota bacterium]